MSCTHPAVRLLSPGEEAKHMPPPYVCQPGARATAWCGRRPIFLCLTCNALVCEHHAGKVCGSVLDDGRRCVRGCVAGRDHGHEYH